MPDPELRRPTKRGDTMKVTSITYEKMVNTGNFEHASASITVELEDGETPGAALNRAKRFVTDALKQKPTDADWASAKNILANPDNYTGYQVKEARRVEELCTSLSDELPF